MKKTVFKALSLVLVVCMLFAFTSCTQEVLVRFVDASGNDLDLAGILGGGAGTGTNVNTDSTPADTTPSAPAADTTPSTPAADTTPSTPAADTTPSAPAADTGSKMPATKDEIVNFYKTAANKVKNEGCASYTKKEWQTISNLNITGNGTVDGKIADIVGGYMTTADQAEDQVTAKGDESKNRFPGFTVADYGNVASATCTQKGSNYAIVIKSVVEDTPKKQGSLMSQFTNSFLAWEDIETEIDNNVSIVKDYKGNVHLMYTVTIEAEITPDGKFVSLKHTTACDIKIAHAKILIVSLDNKEAHLDNYCTYTGFQY